MTKLWLGPNDTFPNPLRDADPDPSVPGLIAVSERIYPGQLLQAYQYGIFPWYSDNQPVLWWSPDPRMVLRPQDFKCSESLKKIIRQFCQDAQYQYMQFLLQSRVNSRIVEFRDGPHDPHPGRLRMVSMIDILEQGISSVYTFYDSHDSSASFGSSSILWQIEQARVLKLPYLYLGYYIKESEKMSYKVKYQPMEGLINDHWQPLTGS